MNNELTVKKSDKKLEDCNIERIALENCDILFIRKEYNKYTNTNVLS